MGVDGRLLMGNGIWVNPKHLPKEWLSFLETLGEKYSDLFEFDRMSGLESRDLIFLNNTPIEIFSELKSGSRRPLIINDSSQLTSMVPTTYGPDVNSKEIWGPSYNMFTIRLQEFSETLRTQFVQEILSRKYELNERYPEKAFLTQEEQQHLTTLLSSKPYTLIGQFMVYTLS